MARSAEQDIVSELIATSEEYRRLADQHSSFDRRLEELAHRKFPSQEEQLEEARLKKKKLHLKDRMQDMIRQHLQAS
jgi:uncharacterized protein YdcH (DUF465 family)